MLQILLKIDHDLSVCWSVSSSKAAEYSPAVAAVVAASPAVVPAAEVGSSAFKEFVLIPPLWWFPRLCLVVEFSVPLVVVEQSADEVEEDDSDTDLFHSREAQDATIAFCRAADAITCIADDGTFCIRPYFEPEYDKFKQSLREPSTLVKTMYHKKHGTDRICFTHHPSSIICSSRYNLDSTNESLRYLSMYDNRCLRYFKGHKKRVVSLCMSPINDSFMSGSLDHSVRIWDLRVNACQGILRLRGRPTVAYDQQGLVFAVAMEGGAIKLFDSRSYDKGPFDTFLVGGDTAEVCDIKFSNDGKSMLLTTTSNSVYVLDAYCGDKRCGFSLEPSPNISIESTFTPDGKYVVSGSGDGTLHAWNVYMKNEVASWSSHIGATSCLKWAPRRAMFAAASIALTFWIPNLSKLSNSNSEFCIS